MKFLIPIAVLISLTGCVSKKVISEPAIQRLTPEFRMEMRELREQLEQQLKEELKQPAPKHKPLCYPDQIA